MKRTTLGLFSTTFSALAAGVALYAAGCGLEALEPVGAQGGGGVGGEGGAVGGGGSGGQGGEEDADRGDPADFPTDCLATCEEACDALDACDGASSSAYPMERDTCLALCDIALNGPFWDDVSGSFR
ncbi:MAG: hypothetical protein JRI68_15520, partial [Deltaproteobacteria bacterium]|nr:hypothetical protein [Deltaproteobacteria bacterium]